MSNLFYHKDLTDAQWTRIKFMFEEKRRWNVRLDVLLGTKNSPLRGSRRELKKSATNGSSYVTC